MCLDNYVNSSGNESHRILYCAEDIVNTEKYQIVATYSLRDNNA